MPDQSLQLLRSYLATVPPGPMPDLQRLTPLLQDAWSSFTGCDVEGMEARKLKDRMEDVEWEPPVLSFRIERHGATALGSIYAQLHRWSVDLDAATADCADAGKRAVHSRNPSVKVKPLAQRVAEAVHSGSPDPAVKWLERDEVRVLVGELVPSRGIPKETLAGRRKRLDIALQAAMAGIGWEKIDGKLHTYRRRG